MEHVETDIGVELSVGDAELTGVAEQQPVLPQRHCGQSQQQRKDEGDAVANDPQPLTEQLVEPFDVGVHVGRERGRRSSVGDEQVQPGDHHECQEEHAEQRDLGPEHTPEHVVAAECVVPEVVHVEPGDRPTEDQDEQEEGAESDEDPAPTDPSTGSVDRQVRGAPHWRRD